MRPEIVYPTDAAIAKGLEVHATTVGVWRKAGMPNTSIEAAREWMRANKPHIGKRVQPTVEELKEPLIVLPDEEDPIEVVKRLRLAERTIAGHIDAWLNRALPEAIAERDRAKGKALVEAERKINIINHKVETLRKEQRQAVSALLTAEKIVVGLERARGRHIDLDEAKDLATRLILPIAIEIRKLPDMGENERERSRLAAKAEALLSMMRQAAYDHVQAKLDAAYPPEPVPA